MVGSLFTPKVGKSAEVPVGGDRTVPPQCAGRDISKFLLNGMGLTHLAGQPFHDICKVVRSMSLAKAIQVLEIFFG